MQRVYRWIAVVAFLVCWGAIVVLVGFLLAGCAPSTNPLAPTAQQSADDRHVPTMGTVVPTLGMVAASVNPYTLSTYTWVESQYRATVTITNGATSDLPYTLAVFRAPYANGHPRFLESQIEFSRVTVTVPAKSALTVTGDAPDGCDVLWQADVYAGALPTENLHPTASPKIHEVTYKFGKSRAVCAREIPQPPSPPPPPPVTPPSVPPVVVPQVPTCIEYPGTKYFCPRVED